MNLGRLITTIALCLFGAMNCAGQSDTVTETQIKEVDAIFKQYANLDSPGVAVAVIRKGKVDFIKSYGAANLEHRVPIDAGKTVFNIASTSKQFTVFAVMLLEEQGKLSLDDNIRKHIPELPDYGKQLTLRHLATHTSGIRSELQLLALAGWTPGDVISRNHVLRMIYRQKELNFDPGENSMYSNSGYTLLSEVVARVSGQSFAEYMQENVLKPLGMNNSFFIAYFDTLIPNMAFPYHRNQNGFYRAGANQGYSGSTGLHTTTEDLAKWTLNFQDPKVGSKKLIKTMNTLGKLNDGSSAGFAYGQFVETYRGLKHIQHGGGSSGYVSYLGRFPDQDLSVLLLGNTSAINVRQHALSVADVFLRDQFTDKKSENSKPLELREADLKRYVGNYWNRTTRTISVSVDENGLLYDIGGGPNLRLEPVARDEFRMLGVGSDIRVKFKTRPDKSVEMKTYVGGRLEDTYVPYTRKKYSPKELKSFVGTYYSDELDTVYRLVMNNDRLEIRHIRFGSIVLSPAADDFFTGSSWRFSSIRFERKNGKITGFRVNSMRVNNISFERLR